MDLIASVPNLQVDESLTELDRHVPLLIKQVSSQAISAAQKVPEVARAVASEVQHAGVVDAASNIAKAIYTKYEPTAKEYYVKYEPVAEQYAVTAWSSLNQLPLFPQVAHIIVPTVAYWSDKYNQTVACLAEGGYTVSIYMPVIPVERIGKVFEAAGNGTTNVVEG